MSAQHHLRVQREQGPRAGVRPRYKAYAAMREMSPKDRMVRRVTGA